MDSFCGLTAGFSAFGSVFTYVECQKRLPSKEIIRLRRRLLLLDDLGRLIGHADARRGRTNAENALFAVVEYLYRYIIAVEAQLTQRVCNSCITALAGCF